jgi:hypothetical protein
VLLVIIGKVTYIMSCCKHNYCMPNMKQDAESEFYMIRYR